LEYTIPQHGADIFAQLLKVRGAGDGHPPKVLDLCCSYGVVATLLRTDLKMRDLYAHYREAATRSLSFEQLAAADQLLLLEHFRADAPRVFGLDVARNAVNYAVAIGALDAGVVENLEREAPSTRLSALMSGVDLITTTGGVGYVTHRTFDRLLEVSSGSVWVAAFCLRTYDYAPIAQALRTHGLATEKVTRTFPQRRFTGPTEKRWAISQVRSRGVDSTGKEDDGFFHADLYLSRPSNEASTTPLAKMLPGLA
jgi:hypothetical protein